MTTSNLVPESSPALLAARGAHLAIAAHVAEHAVPVSRRIYDAAREFDARYFGGTIGALVIEIAAPASPNALATHQPVSPEGLAMVIRIAPSVIESGELLWRDVLLHEMIHAWQMATGNREPSYAGHGPKFAAECTRIGAELGLAPVGVKGRGGKPDCAQWPLNVRPEGYYGELSVRGAKAVARANKASGGAAPKARATKLERALALIAELDDSDRELVRAALDD